MAKKNPHRHPRRKPRTSRIIRKGVFKDRTSEMERLLVKEGYPARDVAIQTGVSKRRVFEFASNRGLPTNPPIKIGTTRERQFCRAVVSLIPQEGRSKSDLDARLDSLAPRFGLSPGAVRRVIREIAASQNAA